MVKFPLSIKTSLISTILGLLLILCPSLGYSVQSLLLKDSLRNAKVGDYIITQQGKMHTAWIVVKKSEQELVIDEISLPSNAFPKEYPSWSSWLFSGAPNNTSWIEFTVDLSSGVVHNWYSKTKGRHFSLPQNENLLTTLLTLTLYEIPPSERKRVGPRQIGLKIDTRSLWEPPLIFNGEKIEGAAFYAWRTQWPKDGSALSQKTIEVYTPKEGPYPAYFPYWLQVRGLAGQAKLRVVDSGSYRQFESQRENGF